MFFVDAGPAADDLLELALRVDLLVNHDEFAVFGIDAGGEQFRGRGDDGVGLFGVDEVVEPSLALGVVAGDLNDVVGDAVLLVGDLPGDLVDDRGPHAGGVVDVDAKDDRPRVLPDLLDVVDHEAGDGLGPVVQDEGLLHVLAVVLAIFDLLAEVVDHARGGPPALDVLIEFVANDLVRGEEAVLDSLPQRIEVDRVAEVRTTRDFARLLGRRGQAEVDRAAEVVEHLAPGAGLLGTPPVAFVDHDEIKEIGRELAEEIRLAVLATDRLIEREVDLVRGIGFAVGDLGHHVAKRLEVVHSGLVNEDVSVREEEHPLDRPGLPEPVDDLEGGVGFARASGHDQERPTLALGHRLDHPLDRDPLVVPRIFLLGGIFVVRLGGDRDLRVGVEALPLAVTRPERVGRGEGVHGNRRLNLCGLTGSIVHVEARAVGRECERDVELLGVAEGLLDAVRRSKAFPLRLDHREGKVTPEEHVVGPRRRAAVSHPAANGEAAGGEGVLAADLRLLVPPRSLEGRGDEPHAGF